MNNNSSSEFSAESALGFKHVIKTDRAPAAIGAYSQAIRAGNTVYISGQIPLAPASGSELAPESTQIVGGGFFEQAHQVFKNLSAIIEESGAAPSEVVKLTVYLTDLNNFAEFNNIMADYFSAPYPARAAVQVAALPKGSLVEVDAIVVLAQA